KSVFDLTLREIERLHGRLGVEDRIKLQAHIDSIRDIENRLSSQSGANGDMDVSTCDVPTADMTVDLLDDGALEQTGQLHMDLAAAALACDQTRIITLQ